MRFRYEDLHVTEDALQLIELAYQISSKFPDDERYNLTSQLRRASNSVLLNIAEGSARNSKKDFARFLTISLGSITECHATLKIASKRGYIEQSDIDEFDKVAGYAWARISALRKSQLS